MKKMVLEDADEQEMEMEIETPKSILVFLYSINSNCLFSNYQIWLFSCCQIGIWIWNKYFSFNEMRTLLDANVHSILYYNSVI